MIKIKSKKANFRRCGIPHANQWVKYRDDRFTPEQVAILKAEPMLIVEVVPDPLPPPPQPPPEDPAVDADPVVSCAALEEKTDKTGKEPAKTGKKGKRQ